MTITIRNLTFTFTTEADLLYFCENAAAILARFDE